MAEIDKYVRLKDLPGWSEEQVKSLAVYLDNVMMQASVGESRCHLAYTLTGAKWCKSNAIYWRHVRGALRWFKGQILRKGTGRGSAKTKPKRVRGAGSAGGGE